MNGWVKKEALIEATKQMGLKHKLNTTFNHWAPCFIQRNPKKRMETADGYVWVHVHWPKGEVFWADATLQVPQEAVYFDHWLMKHSLPLPLLENVQSLVKNLQEGSKVGAW